MTKEKPLAGKRVLVIEDDFYLADDERTLLEEAGAEVVGPFGSRSSASELESHGPLDAAVVDINLGQGPNFDFAHNLRESGVPFAFVTGYDAAVIPSSLSDAPRIEKPIRNRDFVAAVSRLLQAEG